jgi:hypothetical protein
MNESNSALLIKRRDGAGGYDEITHREFISAMIAAGLGGVLVNVWTGKARSGEPITVVWVQGALSGRALSVFELPGGE